jgi:hypothetical protein
VGGLGGCLRQQPPHHRCKHGFVCHDLIPSVSPGLCARNVRRGRDKSKNGASVWNDEEKPATRAACADKE